MPNDHIGRTIYLTGQFDRTIVEVLVQLAREGDTLLDIGANIGYVSACFLHSVRGSKVVCVEPLPDTIHLLQKNLSQFPRRHIVHDFALSVSDGWQNFEICPGNLGKCRLGDNGAIKVKTKSTAKFFADLQSVDLIKIDVEGHEPEIFDGLASQLTRLKPRGILFEGNGNVDARISSILRGNDYSIFGIKKSLTRIKLVPIYNSENCKYHDYVAIRTGCQIPPRYS